MPIGVNLFNLTLKKNTSISTTTIDHLCTLSDPLRDKGLSYIMPLTSQSS